jgi:hypothetical protein
MGNRIDTRVVLGSLRYKSAPDTNLMFNVPLVQTNKENIEFDRNINIDLQQVFDDERQKSDTFRPVCKFSLLFNNSYSGSTNYPPLENNLYYVNAEEAAKKDADKKTNDLLESLAVRPVNIQVGPEKMNNALNQYGKSALEN